MREICRYIVVLAIALAFVACSNDDKAVEGYRVVCHLCKGVKADSVMLYQYEDDYGVLRLCGVTKPNQGNVQFSGVVNKPKIAFLQLDDKPWGQKYFMILENEVSEVRIGNGHLMIRGGKLNDAYFKAFSERRNIINFRKSLRRKYSKILADSLITDSIDNLYAQTDKAMSDSLQKLYVRIMNRDDLVSQLFWSEYSPEMNLSKEIQQVLQSDSTAYKLVR